MSKLITLAIVAFALLVAGLGLIAYRLSELPSGASAGAWSSLPPPVNEGHPGVTPFPPDLSGIDLAPRIMSGTPQFQGPPPAWLPEDPVEARRILHDFRKQTVHAQMDELNRRNRERMRVPPAAANALRSGPSQ